MGIRCPLPTTPLSGWGAWQRAPGIRRLTDTAPFPATKPPPRFPRWPTPDLQTRQRTVMLTQQTAMSSLYKTSTEILPPIPMTPRAS